VLLYFGRNRNAEIGSQLAMAFLDGCQRLLMLLLKSSVEELLEFVRDSGDGRMNDQHTLAGGDTGFDDSGNVLPVGEGGNAGAAKLEDDPR
jgi:hypothetical protein